MKNVLLVYFSGTGITRHYASLIQGEMENNGLNCDCVDLEELTDIPTLWQKKPVALNYTMRAELKRPLSKYPWPYLEVSKAVESAGDNSLFSYLIEDWGKYDLIGFGSPVYAFRPAPVMIRFILDLPLFQHKPLVFSFATHDGAPGDYEAFIYRILELKGFKYIGHIDQSFINSAIAVFRNNFDHVKSGLLLVKRSEQAKEKIAFFLKHIRAMDSTSAFRHRKKDYSNKVIGLPWHLAYSHGINFLLNHFLFGYGIDKENCILCMACVQQCPQGLIEVDDDGYPIRLYHCMYCLRCLNWCPTDALYFSRATRGKARFPGPEVLIEATRQYQLDARLKNK